MSKRKLPNSSSTNSSSKRRSSSSNSPITNNMSMRKKWGRQSSSSASSSVNTDAIGRMFDEIADVDDPNITTMEGICKLCEQLNIDPLEDVRVLVLLHKIGANSKPAQMTRKEWISGCTTLQLDQIDKIRAWVPGLDPGFMERTEFRNLYKFCFQFNRQGTHKTLEKDLVEMLIQLVLKGRIDNQRLETFCKFLRTTKDNAYDRITLDQWMSFLDFSLDCSDLNEYDEECSAWPVLIDDYVDFATSMEE